MYSSYSFYNFFLSLELHFLYCIFALAPFQNVSLSSLDALNISAFVNCFDVKRMLTQSIQIGRKLKENFSFFLMTCFIFISEVLLLWCGTFLLQNGLCNENIVSWLCQLKLVKNQMSTLWKSLAITSKINNSIGLSWHLIYVWRACTAFIDAIEKLNQFYWIHLQIGNFCSPTETCPDGTSPILCIHLW